MVLSRSGVEVINTQHELWQHQTQPLFIPIKGFVGGLGVMASSASVERTFSIAGKVLKLDII